VAGNLARQGSHSSKVEVKRERVAGGRTEAVYGTRPKLIAHPGAELLADILPLDECEVVLLTNHQDRAGHWVTA